MSTHPFSDKAQAILKYEPIELNGLVYYPIRMVDYAKWQAVKPVLCLRQGTLPAVYACMTFLECVWALQLNTGEKTWELLAGLMFLSLRLSDTDIIQPIGNPENPSKITSIRIIKDGSPHDITPLDFNIVRKLIAEQNGAELPDEADNPDLIEAAQDISRANASNLKHDFGDMLASVASERRIRRSEILDWTVKEFDDEIRAINRRYGFFLASIAETQGAKFPKGNPHPTWLFDKGPDEFAGLISMDKITSDHHASISQSDTEPTL